ncbi:DNA topoisomerase (ATP-hydrolyzing) subunit B [Pajaroellobacter abortibovis]|uniref:DNA gyrase subunit B n=1 Tax=Pajaroellobacter abortibovis TaxID=1882918 RepID=A0A1L6MUM7_9BACT|nr:DNA topoisomerase (ATP-hydrolyzing) subunit B [Pajaroellobacter abortibovis]APR99234.1 DNA gyrase subunit B [Pajaroellobacter abortibovis]
MNERLLSPPSSRHSSYSSKSITVLEGLQAVRKRPGMYIGDVHDGSGLHHLIWEVVDNAVDEHLAGFCTSIEVTLHFDGSVTVKDNGRGIPTGMHAKGVSAAEVVMTVLHAGSKFDHASYDVSSGLHGIGVSAVNAVSEWLKLEVENHGLVHFQQYHRGTPLNPLSVVGETNKTGTKVSFKPDAEIFTNTHFQYDLIASRLRELSFLNAGLAIALKDEREEKPCSEIFEYRGGIYEFIELLNKNKEPIHPQVIHILAQHSPGSEKEQDGSIPVTVEIALQWNSTYTEQVFCYTNNIHNRDGGTHLTGFRSALTRVFNQYGTEKNLFKDIKSGLTGEDIREGLTCVISVKHPDPSFDSQTKSKLVSSDVKSIVEAVVMDKFRQFFEQNPAVAKKIIERSILSAKAREAARKAREGVRKGQLDTSYLLGKHADCQSKDPTESEIIIVEGVSAGGTAKQGRNRRFQAILPLRGKILNVERARIDKMLSSNEIALLISALGCGIGEGNFSIEKLRYHHIILMTDADIDGSHIRTLLLTFFYRQMPEIIERGYLYIAQPPLFRVKRGKKEEYLKDQAALDKWFLDRGVEGISVRALQGPILRGDPLFRLAEKLQTFRRTLLKMVQDTRMMMEILSLGGLTCMELREKEKVEQFVSLLQARLEEKHPSLVPLQITISWEKEHGAASLHLVPSSSSSSRPVLFNWELINSPEYEELYSLYQDIASIGSPPYFVKEYRNNFSSSSPSEEDGQEQPPTETSEGHLLRDAWALWEFIDARGRKGTQIQRYKGLGEMNPEQLWETTLNPEARMMLQVKIDDVVQTDQLFTILMGDQVEPRRQFIEGNALSARNLDV